MQIQENTKNFVMLYQPWSSCQLYWDAARWGGRAKVPKRAADRCRIVKHIGQSALKESNGRKITERSHR